MLFWRWRCLRIGLLGCGNIGQFLLKSINQENRLSDGKVVSVYSRSKQKTKKIALEYGANSYDDVESFLASDLDLVVEVATIEFIKEVALDVVSKEIDLVVSSIGAFGDENFLNQVINASNESGVNIYIPSGAIGGLDILKSAKALGDLGNVQITTRKPPSALSGMEDVTVEKEAFKGTAAKAIELFPKNMNIAIAVSLAGLGPEATKVKVIADPKIDKNKHSIAAEGSFGEFKIDITNEAMPSNPKTSYLAALSVLASIQNKNNTLKIG